MADAAIPAATLILARESACGPPQLLMVERSSAMAFAPGAWVFPGGRIDDADVRLAKAMSLGDDGPARIAAVRETLEETAIAVALEPLPAREQAVEMQRALLSGVDLDAIAKARGLRINAGLLTPFSRWIPGHEVSRRFDTTFLLAEAKGVAADPIAVGDECVSARWITADEMLRDERNGRAKLIYPTRKNLERLAQFASFTEMLTDAKRHPIVPITAEIQAVGGTEFVCIPEHAGYPVTRDPLHKMWRG